METQLKTQTLDSNTLVLIEEHVRRLLNVMDFPEARVTCSYEDDTRMLFVGIEAGDEGRVLIGAHGSHLAALQHIIRCLLRAELRQQLYISVDVNGYRSRKEQALLTLAKDMARKAQDAGRAMVLEPMTASDRRTIHAALAGHEYVKTESLGDEPNRRVVIRPTSL